MKLRYYAATALSVLVITSATGCATKGDIEALRLEISELKQITEQARTNATDAKEIAQTNQSKIEAVEDTAVAASNLAIKTDKKVDGVFEKSMLK